jgi:hypothetical protein
VSAKTIAMRIKKAGSAPSFRMIPATDGTAFAHKSHGQWALSRK